MTKEPKETTLTTTQKNEISNDLEEEKNRKRIRQENLIRQLKTSDSQYDYLLSKFTPDKIVRLIKALDSFKYGFNASAPLQCLGPEKCPFFHACPLGNGVMLNNMNKKIPQYDSIEHFPIGDQCILEKTYIEQKLVDYIIEFDIDPNKGSELSLINDLALVDLHKNRCVLFLAAGDREGEGIDFMKVDLGWASDKNGDIGGENSRSYKEHPVFSIIDKLEKRRHKILEELIGTRKVKALVSAKFNPGVQEGALLQEIEKLRKTLEKSKTVNIENDEILELP